jgi:hypothetical protein
MYFQTPFKLIPISKFGDLTDVLSRNQIVTPNEIRPVLGLKPSKQPQADQLVNSNMPLDMQITEGASSAAPQGESSVDADEAELNAQMAELGL